MADPENENAGRGENEPRKSAIRQGQADFRATQAVDLRIRGGKSYAQIGEELGITAGAAHAAYYRGLKLLVPQDELAVAKATALAKLDQWESMVLDLYHQTYWIVNFGKVALDEDGNRMEDFAPKQGCIDRLIKIERERRAIVGYAAPSRRVLEVVDSATIDRAIEVYNREAAELEREARRRESIEADIIDAEVVDDLPNDPKE